MSIFWRFVAFEAIGWAVAAVVLYGAVRFELASVSLALVLFFLWVGKDFVLFPLTKRAYEHGPTHGASEVIGSEVRVDTTLDPDGYVVAGNERWRARLAAGVDAPMHAGDAARVCQLDGITLVVEPITESIEDAAGES